VRIEGVQFTQLPRSERMRRMTGDATPIVRERSEQSARHVDVANKSKCGPRHAVASCSVLAEVTSR
jgi:hypothetical protein